MTIEHASIADPNRHEPKGISVASSGQVYIADGAASGAWAAPPSGRVLEVLVRTAADLPTAVSGVITLAANTIYILDGAISIGSDRIVEAANTMIRGLGSLSSLTTTTTGNVFTASASFGLDGFSLNAPNGTVFSCTGGSFESAFIHEFTVNSCVDIGTFTTWYSLFWDKGAVVSSTSPLKFLGTCNILIIDLVEWITGYTSAIHLDAATFNTCSLNRCGFGYASATTHVTIGVSSGNINAGRMGRITNCTFNGTPSVAVTGATQGDLRWEQKNNLNLASTTKNAQGYMHTLTATVIGVGDGDSGNPKLINGGVNWVNAHSDQFTISTGGRFTYIGTTSSEFAIACTLAGTVASGTQSFRHYIAKNGTKVTASRAQREYTSTAIGSPASSAAILDLDTGDYVEYFIENITGTNDFNASNINMLIVEIV